MDPDNSSSTINDQQSTTTSTNSSATSSATPSIVGDGVVGDNNSLLLKKYFLENFLLKEYPEKFLCYDLLLTFFSSALYSFKTTQILKPYPKDFFDKNLQEIKRDELIEAFEKISIPKNFSGPKDKVDSNKNDPKSSVQDYFVQDDDDNEDGNVDRKSSKLLNWILTQGSFELNLIKLKSLNPKARKLIIDNLEEQKLRLRPNFLFEIKQSNHLQKSKTFQALRLKYGSFYAFHGSPMENFHSILNHGLIFSLNKRSMLGIGTYLTSKIEVALLFSPFGKNYFNGSRLGKKLSCLAMCEVIDHPDILAKKKKTGTYYVVDNDELIRIAYLLLYSSDSATNNLHHLNVSSIPFGKPDTIETTRTSNLAFITLLFLFFFIGFFITKTPEV